MLTHERTTWKYGTKSIYSYNIPKNRKLVRAYRTNIPYAKEHYEFTGLPYTLSQTGKVTKNQFDEIVLKVINDASLTYNPEKADFTEVKLLVEWVF